MRAALLASLRADWLQPLRGDADEAARFLRGEAAGADWAGGDADLRRWRYQGRCKPTMYGHTCQCMNNV